MDTSAGVGEVHMDASLARKYPNTPRKGPRQFILPATRLCAHRRTNICIVKMRKGAGR